MGVIGPYTLLGVLGEGGMGVVYRVCQSEPVAREAALKILKPGMDSRQIVARFEAERQALALMEHPSIATVYDAGLTEEGRPYFVMELVQGRPITEYCDERRFSVEARVRLFRRVCHAVQHAHGRGLIHRDLKPSNVLVSDRSGEPVPKVIDFGIARAVEPGPDAGTRLTREGLVLGTPAYMAPEQLLGEAVDVRADVHALGVLLYELLCGALPFDDTAYRGIAVVGTLERDPPTPSTRLTAVGDPGETAARRETDPRGLRRALSGELDWIVARAMERDRDRRYETANALAMELDRYLADEPVRAGPPTVRYRARKFMARNRGGVAAGTAAVLALVAGTVAASVGMVRAREAEQEARTAQAEAEEVAGFLTDLFALSDPNEGGGDVTARELLDRGAASVRTELADQPVLQGRMLLTMGRVYRNLQLLDEASVSLDVADSLLLATGGPESEDRLDALFDELVSERGPAFLRPAGRRGAVVSGRREKGVAPLQAEIGRIQGARAFGHEIDPVQLRRRRLAEPILGDIGEPRRAEPGGGQIQRMAAGFQIRRQIDPFGLGKPRRALDLPARLAGAEIVDHVEARIARRLHALEKALPRGLVQARLHRVEIGAMFKQALKIFAGEQRDARRAMALAYALGGRKHAHHVGEVAVMDHEDLLFVVLPEHGATLKAPDRPARWTLAAARRKTAR